jgi:drug/metabolite transporter (DMT)-like permease
MCVGSSVLFGMMAFSARIASDSATGAQVAMMRFIGSVVMVGIIVLLWRRPLAPSRFVPLVVRGVAGGTAVLLYFLAIAHIGVGLATLLNYTSPVFTAVLSRVVLGEPLRPRTVIGLAIAMGGVAMVLLGGRDLAHPAAVGWILLGLLSAALSGVAVTAIRVARRTDGALEIFASFAVFGILCTAPVAVTGPMPHLDGIAAVAMVAVVLASTGAQLLMTTALRWVDAPTSGVIAQITVVASYALGVGFLGEEVTALSLAGSAVTMGGVIVAVWGERATRRDDTEPVA